MLFIIRKFLYSNGGTKLDNVEKYFENLQDNSKSKCIALPTIFSKRLLFHFLDYVDKKNPSKRKKCKNCYRFTSFLCQGLWEWNKKCSFN